MTEHSNTITISIIVPVYNAEKYLDECISSVLRQSRQVWELILVDDGSTDRSSAICDSYSDKDFRIRVFHKENGGVSSARNFGIQKALGEWITFIDADDRLSEDFLPSRMDADIDIYITNVQYFPESVDIGWIAPCILKDHDFQSFFSQNAHKILLAPWAKLFRREIIVDKGFSFNPKCRIGEDTLFNLQVISACHSAEVTQGCYYYRYLDYSNWVTKYSNTPEETLQYFTIFLDFYSHLGFTAPKLAAYVYGCFSRITDRSSISALWWITHPEVLEMKKCFKDTMCLKEKVYFSISRMLAFFTSPFFHRSQKQ